ncbi:restriction endonuclease subunit S [Paenibacillus gallinarum]|uniref:Restriction endonuclease subunit S n=1 Tax=Paenibacillus gallinarum TaxID=2762232 RepID=A0ABR8T5P1_9BACL|nr:restriction endonuclease subunit S [Paenibacillus gallinarum]MBD7971093.1 restriction endonuclease subunit S [Paenibacillus gallinarum]
MNAKQLKDSILQYALQGSLFNDSRENAITLYEAIKNYQQKQIESKLIKKVKEEYIVDLKEVPFDIPVNWRWVKIGDIFNVRGGKRVPRGYKLLTTKTPYVYLRVADMKDGSITSNDLHYVDEEVYQGIKNYTISSNDLYLTIAGTIGKVGIIPEEFDGALLTENAVKIEISHVNKLFVKLLLESPIVQNQFQQAVNKVAQPKLSIRNINQVMIPLPPLSVQLELINRISELERKIKLYSELKLDIDLLNSNFPMNLEKSILQYAMQGRLVVQDPNDEPAQQLIEKIQLEKERLIKDKVIKKEKPLLPITEEEIPFDIPSSWEWVRLGDISKVIEYGTSQKTSEFEQKVPVLRMNNIVNGEISYDKLKYVNEDIKDLPKLYLKHQDILFNRTNSYELVGKSACYKGEDNRFSFASYLIRVEILKTFVSPIYINYYLNSYLCRKTQIEPHIIQQNGQANFNGTKLKNIIIPLPPLKEQNRIVQQIEKMLLVKNKLNNAF